MIPDEAVEAAAEAIVVMRQNGQENTQQEYAHAALGAAAPFLQARAWEEGYGLGYSDHVWSKGHEPRERNPYL